MFYFYIIYSATANRFHIGHSSDPWERLKQYNTDSTEKYTGKYNNWELKALFSITESKEEAVKPENFVKKQKSRKLVLKLIDPEFQPTGELVRLVRVSLVRN